MNQNEIITELKLDKDWQTSRTGKPYAAKLVSLLNLINLLEKLPGFKVIFNGQKGNLELVNALPVINREDFKTVGTKSDWDFYNEATRAQDNCRDMYGLFEQWEQVTVKHDTGSYSFPFPVGNKYYDTLAEMAGIGAKKEPVASIKILDTIIVGSEILQAMATATKFISRDDLRPVMQQVCIAIENNKVEVVATDAHRLYQSQKAYANKKKRIEILVSEKDAKLISKIKPASDKTEINILKGNRIMIAGKIFSTFTDRKYMDYRVVVPEYTKYMEFHRERFIKNVKSAMVYSNKSTSQVALNINGQILFKAQDVDFSFEADIRMEYLEKQFKNTMIAFNGKFMVEALSIFKDEKIKLFTDGVATKAGIFTNDKDTVLLMPLMLNNYNY